MGRASIQISRGHANKRKYRKYGINKTAARELDTLKYLTETIEKDSELCKKLKNNQLW